MLLLYAEHTGAGCAVRHRRQGTEFQAETLPAKQAKGTVKKAVGKRVGDARRRPRQGRQGGRQAAERSGRAEERDPQDLRESPGKAGTRRTGHVWVVACLGVHSDQVVHLRWEA
jgi:hypothetical protein